MKSAAREELEKLIREREDEIRALKIALRSLERREMQGSHAGRFVDMRPLDAIRLVLTEHAGRLRRDDLEQILLEGGIAVGKKRAHHNVRISIDLNLRIGNLTEENGWILTKDESESVTDHKILTSKA